MICSFEGPLLRKSLLVAEPGTTGSPLFLCSSRHATQGSKLSYLYYPTFSNSKLRRGTSPDDVHSVFTGRGILRWVGIFRFIAGDLVSSLWTKVENEISIQTRLPSIVL